MSEATTELQPPTLVEHTAFTVVGIETRTSNPREANPATARIPALWQRFTGEQIADQIPKRTNPAYALAVYSGYEGGTDGAFSLLVGAASSATAAPAGMSTARVPSGQYLMFAAEGELSSLAPGLWAEVERYFAGAPAYQRAFTADFERRRLDTPYRLEVFIAVR